MSSINSEIKKELAAKYGASAEDTGSPEVQIAIWTYRINSLIEHFNVQKRFALSFGFDEDG